MSGNPLYAGKRSGKPEPASVGGADRKQRAVRPWAFRSGLQMAWCTPFEPTQREAFFSAPGTAAMHQRHVGTLDAKIVERGADRLASPNGLEPETAYSVPCGRLACVFSFCLARRESRASFTADVAWELREVCEPCLGNQVLPVSDW